MYQGNSGAVVEYLVDNLGIGGSCPACAHNSFPEHRRKIPVTQKILQKNQAQIAKFFFALCTNIVYDIRSG
jgi:hypothetical protein